MSSAENRASFVSSFSAYIPVCVSTGQVVDGLDKAVLTMKKKEHSLVTIAPEYGFGGEETKRDLASVPANSKLIYEIELVDFVKVKSSWHFHVSPIKFRLVQLMVDLRLYT